MPNLVIDIGNSYIKTGVFDSGGLIQTNYFESLNDETVDQLLCKYNISRSIISSVKNKSEEFAELLAKKTQLEYFTREMAYGIQNHYKSPQTLGLDRLAGVAGARFIFPGIKTLVIDGGTCITYDWIDKDGNYFGGSISPGLNMRYKALNYFTGALPLTVTDKDFSEDYGTDTIYSITSGVQNGIKYELIGFIESYFEPENEMNIVLTGGDSIFFDTLLKNSIFAPYIKNEPSLVLIGLNAAIQ